MNYISGLIVVVMLVVESNSIELPNGFKTCHDQLENYTDCLSEATTDAILSIARDAKIFHVAPLEPLQINKITDDDYLEDPNRIIKRNFRNIEVEGLTKGVNIRYRYVSLDSRSIRFNTYNDEINIVVRNYSTIKLTPDGRERYATASITIKTTYVKTEHAILTETYKKNDEEFIRVRKYRINFLPQSVHYHFNDVTDDEAKSYLEGISDETWTRMFEEIFKEKFEHKLASHFKNIANKIFSRFPLDVLFPR